MKFDLRKGKLLKLKIDETINYGNPYTALEDLGYTITSDIPQKLYNKGVSIIISKDNKNYLLYKYTKFNYNIIAITLKEIVEVN